MDQTCRRADPQVFMEYVAQFHEKEQMRSRNGVPCDLTTPR